MAPLTDVSEQVLESNFMNGLNTYARGRDSVVKA